MDTIQKAVLIAHTLIAVLIIVLVLLQRGKGADAGAAFGAGASGTVFGARGSASFFSRMTAVFATLFFVSSLGLAYLSSQSGTGPASLLEGAPPPAAERTDEIPLPGEEEPLSDLPELEAPDEAADLPPIEEERAPEEE